MKSHIIIPIILLIGVLPALAGEHDAGDNENAAAFFSQASVLDSTLMLVGKPAFAAAEQSRKEKLVTYMLDISGTGRAVIDSEGRSYLWFVYDNKLHFREWNTESNLIDNYNYISVDRLGDDKWFFTVGGEMSFSSTTSIGINGRVGTYLWKRFLDAGLGFNAGYSNGGATDNWDVSANITSRLYFTRFFSRCSISPFVGVGLGFVFCPSTDFDPLATAGFNWYISKGSIDFALQYGKASEFGVTAGYTISF